MAFKKGYVPWNKGKSMSITMRKKLSDYLLLNPRKPWLGKRLSEKHKQKIGEGVVKNENVINSWFKKGDKGHLGFQHSIKTKKKMSLLKLGKPSPMQKEKHWNWKGGISFEPYTIEWTFGLKKSIKERDFYICQLCKTSDDLCVHHIDYNKKNCKENNLITLCRSCNVKVNYNRKKWQKLFKSKIAVASL